MKYWFVFPLLQAGFVMANDGMYLSRGGILYPTQETKISLTKEVLSFTCGDGRCAVDVHFEFNNPDSVERKLIVGFQAPSLVGDVPDSLCSVSMIRDLKVMVEGKLLTYSQQAAECEDCPLYEPSRFNFTGENPGIFVSLFEVDFTPGVTRIHHSYTFPASNHVYFDQIFEYILRTGAKWASSRIADLTILFDMGPNAYFYVNDVFGTTAHWEFIGTGKLSSTTFDQGEGITARMVRILSGKLMISVNDFRPEDNIEFGVVTVGSFFNIPTEDSELDRNVAMALALRTTELGGTDAPPLSKNDLRLLRNLLYARYGYAFKGPLLQKRFQGYPLYIPDPQLRADSIPFTSDERRFLEEIVRKEKE